ncbi:Hypothetical predicted protein [Pelobates cultripes]|uniref:Uncharacterized protein n=1 Tax=Pelobates cultripes TaxID=61616 RepID=A0AAD1W0R2_PELCU|nr:Hypothetical predicted protein [Pelobates cultripes]
MATATESMHSRQQKPKRLPPWRELRMRIDSLFPIFPVVWATDTGSGFSESPWELPNVSQYVSQICPANSVALPFLICRFAISSVPVLLDLLHQHVFGVSFLCFPCPGYDSVAAINVWNNSRVWTFDKFSGHINRRFSLGVSFGGMGSMWQLPRTVIDSPERFPEESRGGHQNNKEHPGHGL